MADAETFSLERLLEDLGNRDPKWSAEASSDFHRAWRAADELSRRAHKSILDPASRKLAVEALIERLERPSLDESCMLGDESIRSTIAWALGAFGRDARIALPALVNCCKTFRRPGKLWPGIAQIVLDDEGIQEAILRLVEEDRAKPAV